jgi:hypothetical protein
MTAEQLAQIGTVLFFVAIPWLALYFFLFQRVIRTLSVIERDRFIKEGALPPWRRIVALLPIPLVVLLSNTIVRVLLILWLFLHLLVDSRAHHRRLARLGFDGAFRTRLARVSIFGAFAGVACVVATLLFSIAMKAHSS